MRIQRLNRYLNERTQGEKYATMLCGMLDKNGTFEYINAGHCSPVLVSTDGNTNIWTPPRCPWA